MLLDSELLSIFSVAEHDLKVGLVLSRFPNFTWTNHARWGIRHKAKQEGVLRYDSLQESWNKSRRDMNS